MEHIENKESRWFNGKIWVDEINFNIHRGINWFDIEAKFKFVFIKKICINKYTTI